jgi:hypothetical protein
MNLRRQPLVQPMGVDIPVMPPPQPMQFMQPPPPPQQEEGGSGLDALMQLAQQFRAGQDAKHAAQAQDVQSRETDAPMGRKKPPFADIAGIAQAFA